MSKAPPMPRQDSPTTPDWHALAELASTGLLLVDRDMRLGWLNAAAAELLQIGPRRAAGQSLALVLRHEDVLAQAERASAQRRPMQLRGVRLPAPRDAELRVDIALQPLGEAQLLIELHALAPSSHTATPLSASLRGFAHEVKNPLAGLRGAAQLLQRRVGDEDLAMLAGLVIAEADRLGELANRLLHHDGSAARLAPVNLHELLERLAALLRAEPAAPQQRHDYDPSLPDVEGDADRLLQVLLNLARNAIEAGARTLTWRTRVEHGIRLGERVARTAVRVDLLDDGHGVPEALRESLFQPLVSGRADGNGLGLALSREIARDHGGELRYAGREGETVFSLYLPLQPHD